MVGTVAASLSKPLMTYRKKALLLPACLLIAIICKAQYAVYPFADTSGKWGIMGGMQKIILPPTYTYMSFFLNHNEREPTAIVRQNKYGVINGEGRLLLPCAFDSIIEPYFETEFVKIKKGRLLGLAKRKTGEIILQPLYNQVSDLLFDEAARENYFAASLNGRQYYFTKEGKPYRPAAKTNLQTAVSESQVYQYSSAPQYSYSYRYLRQQGDLFYYEINSTDEKNISRTDTVKLVNLVIDSFMLKDNPVLLATSASYDRTKKGLAILERPYEKAAVITERSSALYDEIIPLYKFGKPHIPSRQNILCWLVKTNGSTGVAMANNGKLTILPELEWVKAPSFKVYNRYDNEQYVLVKTKKGNMAYADIYRGYIYIKE